MRHWLFKCTLDCSPNEGEEFLVGADTYAEAREIAEDNFDEVRFLCELSEEHAEASGLDEY